MVNCYKSYLHVERLGRTETEGLLNGKVYCTFKLDGTNSCVWVDDCSGEIHCGSRRREIGFEADDNAGFATWMNESGYEQDHIRALCRAHSNYIVYGEWLGRNTFVGAIKKYRKGALSHLWIFDIYDRNEERYLNWEEMEEVLAEFDLLDHRIPLAAVLENPTIDDIIELANNNKFLLEDTDIIGEGIVCKNYSFYNRYGRYTVGKYVREDFNPGNSKPKREIKVGEVEQMFVEKYLTAAELEKAKAKTVLASGVDFDNDLRNGKFIGMFLNILWKDTIEENIVDFCKRAKNPQIDFAALNGKIKVEGRKFLGVG